tara:strand:+ start:5421 stop:6239 length:819 start_codon:yes stop_codon:yes gene_type:complete
MKRKLLYLFRWDLLFFKIKEKIRVYKKVKLDISYWKMIKDIHKGKPGFVVGNGPSLKMDDLSKIHELGFISIASNKIYYAFKETKWRPNYYTISDILVWNEIKNKIHKEIDTVHVPSFLGYKDCNVIVKTWKNLSNSFSIENRRISNDLSKGASAGFTVTYENIQFAMHLGLNPIYLIGCDHYYEGEKEVHKSDELVKHKGKNTHFISNYRNIGDINGHAPISKMTKSYEIANLYSESKGVKIFNSTRGGYLEAFDRLDLDKIFNKIIKKNK